MQCRGSIDAASQHQQQRRIRTPIWQATDGDSQPELRARLFENEGLPSRVCCGYINRRTTADLRAADEGSCTDLVSTSTSGDSSTRHLPTPHLAVVLLLIPEAVDVTFCIQHIRTGNLNPPPAAPQTAQDRSCSLDSDQLCATLIARFPEPNPPSVRKFRGRSSGLTLARPGSWPVLPPLPAPHSASAHLCFLCSYV